MKLLSVFAVLVFNAMSISAQESKPQLKDLGWITGCWQMESRGRTTTERWGPLSSNAMLGTSQTVANGRTVSFEFLRIVDNGQGAVYIARPSNAKDETSFAGKSGSATDVVFENPTHDFPQRIIYRKTGPDAMLARIEGKNGDKEMGMDFPMKRIKCE